MLDKHPFLLPRKTGDKIFLHPAAALTAFVAAALILSIDGTREVSIVEVLASLKDESSEGNGLARSSDLRSELGRLITTELSAGGYAAAIFGVALFSSQMEEVKQAIAFQDDFGALDWEEPNVGDRAVVDEEQDQYLLGAQGNEIEILRANSERVKDADVNAIDHLVLSISDVSKNEKTKLEIGDISKIVLDGLADEGQEFTIPGDIAGAVKFNAFPYEQENSPGLSDAAVNGGSLSIESQGNSAEVKSSVLAEAVYGAFQKAFYEGVENGLLEKSSLNFAVGTKGEFLIISLNKSELKSTTDIYPLQGDHNLFGVTPSVLSETGLLVSASAEGPPSFEKQTNSSESQPTISNLPIVGHDLTSLGKENVQLSDGIDVVFFDGGEYKATGFELGKDLLWFFLEPLDIASAESSIVNDSDLILSFGGVGTLTLVGVLDNMHSLDFV